MSSAKWRLFCLGLNELKLIHVNKGGLLIGDKEPMTNQFTKSHMRHYISMGPIISFVYSTK